MRATAIEKAKAAEMRKLAIKFDTAKKIREILDEARREFGAAEWDDDGIETEIIELVTEDE